MIDLLANILFRCPHRRLTRPLTPVSKPGSPSGETYVVCLDCGTQFAYDWEEMRMGGPVKTSANEGVFHPNMPKPPKTKLKYALLGSALPFAVLLGKAILSKPREPRPNAVKKVPAANPNPDEKE